MCGIFGYVGWRQDAALVDCLVGGLGRLLYRGYDSAGLVWYDPDTGSLVVEKRAGELHVLQGALTGRSIRASSGLGHTRWATHGPPTDLNAHPHLSCRGHVAVVHNGIITNARQLRAVLEGRGHRFVSETDTEVLAHLIGEYNNDPLSAVRSALQDVQGQYGIAVLFRDHPDQIVFARSGSPLMIGVGENERFIASDTRAYRPFTDEEVVVPDGSMGVLTPSGYQLFNLEAVSLSPKVERIEWALQEIELGGCTHFMEREILDQPEILARGLSGRLTDQGRVVLGGLRDVEKALAGTANHVFTASGTSLHAAMIGRVMVQEIAGLSAQAEIASELAHQEKLCLPNGSAVWLISQSGETADLIQVIPQVRRLGWPLFGLCNVSGTTIARETDAGIFVRAGAETAVASTKAFTAQVLALHLLALYLRQLRKLPDEPWLGRYLEGLRALPDCISQALSQREAIREIAGRYAQYHDWQFLGRGVNHPVALEGALKLLEVVYCNAVGRQCAEMKHGPLATIDANFPSVVIVPLADIHRPRILGNIAELRARNGRVLAIATEGDSEIVGLVDDVVFVPRVPYYLTPFVSVVPLQLLAYEIAVLLGRNVDRPRNLAKSVTVE